MNIAKRPRYSGWHWGYLGILAYSCSNVAVKLARRPSELCAAFKLHG